jgi:hypothetical protein
MEFIYSSSNDKESLDDIEDKGLNKYIGCNCLHQHLEIFHTVGVRGGK